MTAARKYPLPAFEKLRVENFRRLDVLNRFDPAILNDIVRMASELMAAPVAAVSFIDDDKQHIVASHGADLTQTPRELSFCTYTVLDPQKPLVIPDTLDSPLFKYHPFVVAGPSIRSYAGTPVVSPDFGFALGSVCVLDVKPRRFTDDQLRALSDLSKIVTLALK